MKQIPLPISLPERTIFNNFVIGRNQLVVSTLKDVFSSHLKEQQILLWSHNKNGKTHLLLSLCHLAAALEKQIAYVPMRELQSSAPGILDGLENLDAVCIDDVDLVANDRAWATEIFRLINACRDAKTPLILSTSEHPHEVSLAFEDLRSRLLWGTVFHLKRLKDEDLLSSLYARSRAKGLEFPVDAAEYLLKHCKRNTAAVVDFLDVLDEESLAQKRRITIPLIKSVMAQHDLN